MLGSVTHIWVKEVPGWLHVVMLLPTGVALIVLIIVLVRERRKRSRP
jgi:hypothetical protein